jgi:WD40 repeat protein
MCLSVTAFAQTLPQAKPALVLAPFSMGPSASAFVVSPDSKQAIVAGTDKTLRFFDLASGKETAKSELPSYPNYIGITADAKNLVMCGNRGPLQILDGAGKLVKELAKDTNASAISADGAVVATSIVGGTPNTISLFSIPDGKALATIKLTREASSLSFSKDHALLAIGLFEGPDNVLLADVKTGVIKSRFQHGTKQVTLVLSPDGGTIASNGNFPENQGLKFFDVKTGKATAVEGTQTVNNPRFVFLPGGKTLLYTTYREMQTIDIASAKITGTFGAKGESTTILALTPDGKRVLRNQLGNIEVWDLPKP